MTRKQRRLILIGSSLAVLAIAVALVLNSLRDSIVFFNSPTDIADNKTAPGKRVRLGGMVKFGIGQAVARKEDDPLLRGGAGARLSAEFCAIF